MQRLLRVAARSRTHGLDRKPAIAVSERPDLRRIGVRWAAVVRQCALCSSSALVIRPTTAAASRVRDLQVLPRRLEGDLCEVAVWDGMLHVGRVPIPEDKLALPWSQAAVSRHRVADRALGDGAWSRHSAAKIDTELPNNKLGLRNYVSRSNAASDNDLETTVPATSVSSGVRTRCPSRQVDRSQGIKCRCWP